MGRISKASVQQASNNVDDDVHATVDDQDSADFEKSPIEELVAKSGMKNPNTYQEDIFVFFKQQLDNYQTGMETSSLLVNAVAGSGKTTTVVAAANLIPTELNTIFLAFNASISKELGKRLPPHIESRTLNSLGFRMIIPYVKSLGCVVDPYKFCKQWRTNKIIRDTYDWRQREKTEKYVRFLVGKCKAMGVIPVGVDDGWAVDDMEATDETLMKILQHYGEIVDPIIRPSVFQMTRNILQQSWSETNIYETNCIDFDDQKWLTVCKRPMGSKLVQPTYDVVIIDEVQDVNAIDLELIKMVLKPNGVVVGVGDKNQAIYGFRGADTNALTKFGEFFNAKELPLSITYRCGKEIVKYAQELVPAIEAAKTASDGEVTHLTQYDATTFKAGDLVLCRNNAPLMDLAYKLVKSRVPVHVVGRDIGSKLVTLIHDCVGEKKWERVNGKNVPVMSVDGKSTGELSAALLAWKDTQLDVIRMDDPDDESGIQAILDRVDSIKVFIEGNVDGKVSTIIEQIESLFGEAERDDMVICSSIHKAKGLESDRVFIHEPDYLYPWYVEKETWQYSQECNLDYVARTRAKSFYGILSPDGWVED